MEAVFFSDITSPIVKKDDIATMIAFTDWAQKNHPTVVSALDIDIRLPVIIGIVGAKNDTDSVCGHDQNGQIRFVIVFQRGIL
ncbi:MAG: hypothetical protein FJ303_14165 [Planctomycetes bacterium]|nr:hypothetical protein [Planctomycetota bacterium]